MDDVPPVPSVPSIPARQHDAPGAPHAAKRHSVGAPGAASRKAPNRVKVRPADPEVISSLISSLSAISSPAEALYDHLLPTAAGAASSSLSVPSSPAPTRTSFAAPAPRHAATSHGAAAPPHFPTAAADDDLQDDDAPALSADDRQHIAALYPDNAALPPVVRTSKPPSGLSPLTASPAAAAGKRASSASQRLHARWNMQHPPPPPPLQPPGDTWQAIGNISVDAAQETAPETSGHRGGGGGGGSGGGGRRSVKSLNLKASRERMREIDKQWRKGSPRSVGRPDGPPDSPIKIVKSRDSGGGGGGERGDMGPESPLQGRFPRDALLPPPPSPLRSASVPASPAATGADNAPSAVAGPPALASDASSVGSGRVIPARESSLRHGKKQKRRSRRDSSVPPPREVPSLASLSEDEGKGNGVPLDREDGEAEDAGSTIRRVKAPMPEEETAKDDAPRTWAHGILERSKEPTISILEDNAGEESALKRIQELKARKESRERSLAADEEQARREGAPKLAVTPTRPSAPAASPRSRPADGYFSASKDVGKENLAPQPPEPTDTPSPSSTMRRNSLIRRDSLTRAKRASLSAAQDLAKHARTFSSSLSSGGERSTSVHEEPPPPSETAAAEDPIEAAVQAYLEAPRLSQRVRDPATGRAIYFSEVGDPQGSVVFSCVGMGTTRFISAFFDELAATLKLRLITLDRPGIGDSEPHADGLDTPLGWPGTPPSQISKILFPHVFTAH